MKLFSKYYRTTSLPATIIFLIATFAIYFLIRRVLISQVDEDIVSQQGEISSYLKKVDQPPDSVHNFNQRLVYKKVPSPIGPFFNEEVFRIPHTDKVEIFRQINYTQELNGAYYQVTIGKSIVHTLSLLKSIVVITGCTILVIILGLLGIDWIILRRLWKPFYQTLKQVERFQFGTGERLRISNTKVTEFAHMNRVLESSITAAEKDFRILKQFTENASHELQTPLAIIRSKLDLILQQTGLSSEQSQAIDSAYGAVKRLKHISKSLLLLTKIGNIQYRDKIQIDLGKKIAETLAQFVDMATEKNIAVQVDLKGLSVTMNIELCDTLLNNLVGNAIRHNYEGGHVFIQTKDNKLVIKNSGAVAPLDKGLIFSRFYKPEKNSDSTGLGLAIVKEICEQSGCSISYHWEEKRHVFVVEWDAY